MNQLILVFFVNIWPQVVLGLNFGLQVAWFFNNNINIETVVKYQWVLYTQVITYAIFARADKHKYHSHPGCDGFVY